MHDKRDITNLKHALKRILYPIRTADLRELMRTEGHGDAIVDLLSHLPWKTFTSAQEVLAELQPFLKQDKIHIRR